MICFPCFRKELKKLWRKINKLEELLRLSTKKRGFISSKINSYRFKKERKCLKKYLNHLLWKFKEICVRRHLKRWRILKILTQLLKILWTKSSFTTKLSTKFYFSCHMQPSTFRNTGIKVFLVNKYLIWKHLSQICKKKVIPLHLLNLCSKYWQIWSWWSRKSKTRINKTSKYSINSSKI